MLRKQRQFIEENQAADGKQKHSAENLHRVKVFSETLVKFQKASDAHCREQKWNRQSRRIERQQQNALADGVLGSRKREHAGEDRTDARRPSEGKGEAQQESAHNSGLAASTDIAQMNVPVEPARHPGS